MKILFKGGIYQLLLLVVMGLLVVSCSKDKKDDPVPGMKGDATIKMIVSVPLDIESSSLSNTNIVKGVSKASLSNKASSELEDGLEGFVAYDNLEVRTKFYAPTEDQAAIANKAANASLTAASTPLTKLYRVLMYKGASTTPEINVVVTPGIDPGIQVDAGFNYKLVVFSINENTVPNVTGVTNTVASTDLSNKDVLYYTTTINTVYGNNDMHVLLKRKTTQINLDIDVRGLYGGIFNTTKIDLGYGAAAAFTTVIKTANFDLFNESFGTLSDVAPIAFSSMQFSETIGSGFGSLKGIMSFYTVGATTVPANQFKIRLANLDIWADVIQSGNPPAPVNVYKHYTNTLLFPAANNPGFSTTAGTKFGASVEFMLPAIVINSKIWAPANLVYEPSYSSTYPYRFKPDNDMDPYDASAASGFWNWRALLPTTAAPSNAGDPCALVFPNNTWRMPTVAELQGLINLIPGNGGSTISSNLYYDASIGLLIGADIRYVFNRNTPATKLDLRMYGYRNTNGTYTGRPEAALLGLLGGFGRADYWSSEASGGNASYLEGTYDGIFGLPVLPTVRKPTIEAGARNIGRNIRCIRDVI